LGKQNAFGKRREEKRKGNGYLGEFVGLVGWVGEILPHLGLVAIHFKPPPLSFLHTVLDRPVLTQIDINWRHYISLERIVLHLFVGGDGKSFSKKSPTRGGLYQRLSGFIDVTNRKEEALDALVKGASRVVEHGDAASDAAGGIRNGFLFDENKSMG